jgi:hypothetical protein
VTIVMSGSSSDLGCLLAGAESSLRVPTPWHLVWATALKTCKPNTKRPGAQLCKTDNKTCVLSVWLAELDELNQVSDCRWIIMRTLTQTLGLGNRERERLRTKKQ